MSIQRFDDISFIVRECGERTADVCVRRLFEMFGQQPHRVSARPFSATLRQSLELGAHLGRPWTLCIDADVLVLPGLIEFIEQARDLPENIFEAQALVIDKLLPMRRPAGNHLYRTDLIGLALPLIPAADSLRPESDMILAMAKLGHPAWQARTLVGIHDFEQSYEDIYKKAFLHGHKHDYLIPMYRPIWEALSPRDTDFRVALMALESKSRHERKPDVCRDYMDGESRAVLASIGLKAKDSLESIDDSEIAAMAKLASCLEGEARRLAEQMQSDADAGLFPAANSEPSPGPDNWFGASKALARRAALRLRSIFGAR